MPENKKKIPEHIGIIIDGNKRWATERNLKPLEGCKKGYGKIRYVPEWFFLRGVKIVSVFLFSNEIWQQPREEVNCLMKEVKKLFFEDLNEFLERKYKILFSGKVDELPGDLPEICTEAENQSKSNQGGILNICLNYGGQEEVLEAIRKMIKNNIKPEQVHEGMIRKYLYHNELGDPDMIIRLASTYRLSGFLWWQSTKSELMFLNKDWPDFEMADVEKILEEYKQRKLV